MRGDLDHHPVVVELVGDESNTSSPFNSNPLWLPCGDFVHLFENSWVPFDKTMPNLVASMF